MLARQGDILIIPVTSIPKNAKPVARENGALILARGEQTGHNHAVLDRDVELVSTGTGDAADRWLRVGQGGAVIVHPEHAPITLPAGDFEVRRQVEYHPAAIRRVAD